MDKQNIISKNLITKGWSDDQKYELTTDNGSKYLLRISPIERYETRKKLFSLLKKAAALNIPMCEPISFGVCNDGVYILMTWIDGVDAEPVIATYSTSQQYALGILAGKILRQIHSIPAPSAQEDWYARFSRKAENKIKNYRACPLHFDGADAFITYIQNNRNLLKYRPQCFQHGDYHIGNMMLENNKLIIIDFDRFDFGDPWEEFNRIVWTAQASPSFASGQINGYFDGTPPLQFFRLLAFYIASNTLSSIYWALSFGQKEIDTMMRQSQEVLSWFHHMQTPIPSWYQNPQQADFI